MADQRTRETLEALADLFLTDETDEKTSADDRSSEPTPQQRRPAAQVEQPVLGRLPPKPAAAQLTTPKHGKIGHVELSPEPADAAGTLGPDQTNQFDSDIAGAIGTTDVQPLSVPLSDRAQAHVVEAVFLSNLPGYAGPWLTQYAHRLAQRHGPVAILHIGEEQIDVEMVGTTGPEAPELPSPTRRDFLRDGGDGGSNVLLNSLHDLSQLTPSAVKTWLIHLPTEPSPTMLAMALELPRWTILSGSDDAAVASDCRLLKRLLAADQQTTARQVGLMVMGDEQAASQAAARKLNAAASRFLDRVVGLVGWHKQMVPVSQRMVGCFAGSDDLWSSVRAFLETINTPLLCTDAPTSQRPVDRQFASVVTDGVGDREGQVSVPPPVVTSGEPASGTVEQATRDADGPPSELSTDPAPSGPLPGEVERRDPVEEGRRSSSAPGGAHPDAMDVPDEQTYCSNAAPDRQESEGPDLAQFLAGAIGLEASCPQHPKVQLVLDERGVMHLLKVCQAAGPGGNRTSPHLGDSDSDGTTRLHGAIVDLLDTRAWVSEHLELIQLTQRQCRFDQETTPVLHLFTDQAKAAAKFARHGEPFVRVHLLERVEVGDRRTWYCTELN